MHKIEIEHLHVPRGSQAVRVGVRLERGKEVGRHAFDGHVLLVALGFGEFSVHLLGHGLGRHVRRRPHAVVVAVVFVLGHGHVYASIEHLGVAMVRAAYDGLLLGFVVHLVVRGTVVLRTVCGSCTTHTVHSGLVGGVTLVGNRLMLCNKVSISRLILNIGIGREHGGFLGGGGECIVRVHNGSSLHFGAAGAVDTYVVDDLLFLGWSKHVGQGRDNRADRGG